MAQKTFPRNTQVKMHSLEPWDEALRSPGDIRASLLPFPFTEVGFTSQFLIMQRSPGDSVYYMTVRAQFKCDLFRRLDKEAREFCVLQATPGISQNDGHVQPSDPEWTSPGLSPGFCCPPGPIPPCPISSPSHLA